MRVLQQLCVCSVIQSEQALAWKGPQRSPCSLSKSMFGLDVVIEPQSQVSPGCCLCQPSEDPRNPPLPVPCTHSCCFPCSSCSHQQGKCRLQLWNTVQTQLVPDHGAGQGSALTGAHLSTGGAHRAAAQPGAALWPIRAQLLGDGTRLPPSPSPVRAPACSSPAPAARASRLLGRTQAFHPASGPPLESSHLLDSYLLAGPA